jgi:hypothetical protein
MISRAMVATKPGSPGRARRKPLKPIACGNAGSIRWTCGDLLVCFCFSHARLRVHWTPGIPHALRGGTVDDKTRAHATRSQSRVAKSWLFENGFGASTSCSLPPLWGRAREGGWPHRHCSCGTFIVKAPPPVWAPLPNPPPQGGRERTAVVEIATLPTEAGRRNYFATCVRKDAAGSPRNPALVFHPTG